MKRWLIFLTVLSLLALGSVAYAQCCAAKKAPVASAELCGKCGEVAGSEKCCAGGAEVCPACGLHAGSPGCKAKCAAAPVQPE